MAWLPGSVRGRLLLLVIVTTLPVFGAMTMSYQHARSFAIEQYRHVAFTDTADLGSQYQQLAAATQKLLRSLSTLAQIRSGECDSLLAHLAPAYPYLTNVGVASTSGDIVCTARPGRGSTSARRPGSNAPSRPGSSRWAIPSWAPGRSGASSGSFSRSSTMTDAWRGCSSPGSISRGRSA